MTNELRQQLDHLLDQESKIRDKAKALYTKENPDLYVMDLMVAALYDRTLHLIVGFVQLIESSNFLTASHLVRLHLDNAIRFHGFFISPNLEETARKVLGGERMESLKDREDKKMKDWYLCDSLSKIYPWVANVYKETSGLIHFSNKHLFASSKLMDESSDEYFVKYSISKIDYNVNDESRLEAIQCMNDITCIVHDYADLWIEIKSNWKESN